MYTHRTSRLRFLKFNSKQILSMLLRELYSTLLAAISWLIYIPTPPHNSFYPVSNFYNLKVNPPKSYFTFSFNQKRDSGICTFFIFIVIFFSFHERESLRSCGCVALSQALIITTFIQGRVMSPLNKLNYSTIPIWRLCKVTQKRHEQCWLNLVYFNSSFYIFFQIDFM